MVRLSSRKAPGSHKGVSLGGVLFLQFWRDDVAKAARRGLVPGADFAMMAAMYRAVTRQIEVTVEPNFVPEQSSADRSRYFWSYTIVITNSGEETVQLKTRHWIITDASGRQQEVKGEGVVGEQPILAPGERFEYTSGVPLSTASGFMTGRYQMVSETGERFEIDVPTFSLDSPDNKRVLN
ncbi:ApaG protein [Bradyrhizobium sp. USDA 372]